MTDQKPEPETIRVRFLGPAHVLEVGSRRLVRGGEPVEIPSTTYRRLAQNPHLRLEVVRPRPAKSASIESPTATPDTGDNQAG